MCLRLFALRRDNGSKSVFCSLMAVKPHIQCYVHPYQYTPYIIVKVIIESTSATGRRGTGRTRSKGLMIPVVFLQVFLPISAFCATPWSCSPSFLETVDVTFGVNMYYIYYTISISSLNHFLSHVLPLLRFSVRTTLMKLIPLSKPLVSYSFLVATLIFSIFCKMASPVSSSMSDRKRLILAEVSYAYHGKA